MSDTEPRQAPPQLRVRETENVRLWNLARQNRQFLGAPVRGIRAAYRERLRREAEAAWEMIDVPVTSISRLAEIDRATEYHHDIEHTDHVQDYDL